MKIAIGGDHAGFEYKEVLIEMIRKSWMPAIIKVVNG